MYAIKRILLGIDGSEDSYKAASFTAALAEKLGASVTLIYIASDKYTGSFAAKPTYTTGDNVLAGDRFDRAKEYLQERNVPFDTIVELGDPAEVILSTAAGRYDAIVVGTRGLTGFREMVMGSVSQKIVQNSKIPVLVVPKT
ncbi:MAG: universal stress protein [Methanomassiliicoccus sp.]|nr:universal stress protein [Methanomassiliicoccus sp.]